MCNINKIDIENFVNIIFILIFAILHNIYLGNLYN